MDLLNDLTRLRIDGRRYFHQVTRSQRLNQVRFAVDEDDIFDS